VTVTRQRVVIVTAVYNEEAALPIYTAAVRDIVLSQTDCDFGVLFVDDGSTDRSWATIREICSGDRRFSGVRLSRHYGAHIADSAGLAHADGEAVVTLACDLQDPPEVVLEFVAKWRQGAQIVWGVRRNRKDSLARSLTSAVFQGLLRRFAMPRPSKVVTGGFFLLDRRVAESVRQFQERNRIMFALVAWTGFEQATVEYDRRERVAGTSGWSWDRMMKTMYDAFIGFSYLPIRIMSILGMFAFLLSVILGLYLVYNHETSNPVPGWTSTLAAISFFFGIQFLLMGISGEYLYRIYQEVVQRPLYFVSDTIGESTRR
jgi:dolichol-phosphate mannosyltransferase